MSFTGRLLIIGGSDAGVVAALRARELARAAEVTVLVADEFGPARPLPVAVALFASMR